MSVEVITYKGKKIIYTHYAQNCQKGDFECMLKTFRQMKKVLQENPTITLDLANFENTIVNPEFMKEVKSLHEIFNKREVKSAVIGLTSLQMILLKGSNKLFKHKVQPFRDKNSALDYLASL